MAKTATETSPWPDGPKMYAEIATEAKRFLNMRPNSRGIMPVVF